MNFSSSQVFQVSWYFSMIFIKFFKTPYFQVFQAYPHFSRFSRSNGSLQQISKKKQTNVIAQNIVMET